MSHNDDGFFLSEKSSKARLREAENARKNRAEILKAFSQGKVTRRELVKWGLITTGGMLAPIHGLNPFVNSAYASGGGSQGSGIPTGAPPSPTFGVQPFSTPMPRFDVIARGTNPMGGDLHSGARWHRWMRPTGSQWIQHWVQVPGQQKAVRRDQSGRTRVLVTTRRRSRYEMSQAQAQANTVYNPGVDLGPQLRD